MPRHQTIIFLILTAFLPFVIILFFHQSIPFHQNAYHFSFHHFLPDQRISQNRFYLPNALAQADSQWYLKIASDGYPKDPIPTTLDDKSDMDSPSYAFFPLYPMLIRLFSLLFNDIELSAFLLTTILLITNTILLHKYFGFKTTLLMLVFPFSIFFRSYYTESLQILLLIPYIVSLNRGKFFITNILAGLLFITKGTTLLLLPLAWYKLLTSPDSLKTKIIGLSLSLIPLVIWSLYCYFQTGDLFYFSTIRSLWFETNLLTPLYIFGSLLNTPYLQSHFPHFSYVENTLFLFFSVVLLKAKKILSHDMFLVGLALFILPIFTSDLTSFSRYQSINIPMFYFLGKVRHSSFLLLTTLFLISLLFITPFFINWYWIG